MLCIWHCVRCRMYMTGQDGQSSSFMSLSPPLPSPRTLSWSPCSTRPPRPPSLYPAATGVFLAALLLLIYLLFIWGQRIQTMILTFWCWSRFALWLGTSQFLQMFLVCWEWCMSSRFGVQSSVCDGFRTSFLILLLRYLEAILFSAHNLEYSGEFFRLSLCKSPFYP